jgi:hypothetical protein
MLYGIFVLSNEVGIDGLSDGCDAYFIHS